MRCLFVQHHQVYKNVALKTKLSPKVFFSVHLPDFAFGLRDFGRLEIVEMSLLTKVKLLLLCSLIFFCLCSLFSFKYSFCLNTLHFEGEE